VFAKLGYGVARREGKARCVNGAIGRFRPELLVMTIHPRKNRTGAKLQYGFFL
jgi:hypothetical protein